MSNELAAFFKENKKEKKNEFFPATKDLCDAEGKPLMWELRPIPTIVMKRIETECTEIRGKNNFKFDQSLFQRKKVAAAVVFPNLRDAALVDNYMANYAPEDRTPENLIVLMVDNYKEFIALQRKVDEMNGFAEDADKAMKKDIEIAKN